MVLTVSVLDLSSSRRFFVLVSRLTSLNSLPPDLDRMGAEEGVS